MSNTMTATAIEATENPMTYEAAWSYEGEECGRVRGRSWAYVWEHAGWFIQAGFVREGGHVMVWRDGVAIYDSTRGGHLPDPA